MLKFSLGKIGSVGVASSTLPKIFFKKFILVKDYNNQHGFELGQLPQEKL
jgi:hypothetical protein